MRWWRGNDDIDSRAHRKILSALNDIKELLVSTQDQINQEAADIEAALAAINTGIEGLRQQITDLQAQNPTIDLSSLTAAVDDLQGTAAEFPTPAPAPAPEPPPAP